MTAPGSALPNLILFEDEHLLVVNKPAGMNTHMPSMFAGEGLYEWLRHREPRWSRLAIIHRLDKETSGVMVFAKSPEANRSLTDQFAGHAIRKQYLLVTDRTVRRREFNAVSKLVRAGDRYLSRLSSGHGEQAETRFRVAGDFREPISANPRNDLGAAHGANRRIVIEAWPITGRTHQIRVHAAEHGFPILGDVLYGGTQAPRVFLHSAELVLQHPITRQELTFFAPVEFARDARSVLREALVVPAQTNAFRLLHGASDGWPGWYLDRIGDFLLSQSAQPLSDRQAGKLRQLIESGACSGVYHKRLARQVRRLAEEDSSPRLVLGDAAPERFQILENGLRFELSFSEGYSVGLFLDQRDNRRRLIANHVAADFPLFPDDATGREVLNTFAYTCGFSVCAAKAGTRTTSLDLSKKYLNWGRRNFALNNLDPAAHDFIYGDAFDWLRRFRKKTRTFDVIVLDPPTFSQSKERGVFRAEKDYGRLVADALPVLRPNGVLLASTNVASLKPEEFLRTIEEAAHSARRRMLQRHYVPQPPDFPISRAEPAYLKTVWLRFA